MAHKFSADAEEFKAGEEVKVEIRGQDLPEQEVSLVDSETAFKGALENLALFEQENLITFNLSEKSWVRYRGISPKIQATGLRYGAALLLPGNAILICGGILTELPTAQAYIIRVKFNFGTFEDNSQSIQEMLYPRILHSLVFYKGTPYVLGGQSDSTTYLNNCEAWRGDMWSIEAPMNHARSTFAAYANDSGIFVMGGFNGKGSIENSIERFEDGNWNFVPVNVSLLAGSAVIDIPNTTQVLILGGSNENGPNKQVLEFDCGSLQAKETDFQLNTPRTRPIAFRSNARVCVLGGGSADGEVLDSTGLTLGVVIPPQIDAFSLVTMPYVYDPKRS